MTTETENRKAERKARWQQLKPFWDEIVDHLRDLCCPGESQLTQCVRVTGKASDLVVTIEPFAEIGERRARNDFREGADLSKDDGQHRCDFKCETCPRCGEGHSEIELKRFGRRPQSVSHWGICPVTGEPILVLIFDHVQVTDENG